MTNNGEFQFTILRLEANPDGMTLAWLYRLGREVYHSSAPRMSELLSELSEYQRDDWDNIKGIYVYSGPAGFTKLRATHVSAAALGLAKNIPICGYSTWKESMASAIPEDVGSVKAIYPEIKS